MTDTTALERGIGAAPTRARRRRFQWRDPWGHPRGLALVTWIYILWSIVPVLLAIFTMLIVGFLAPPFLAGDDYAALSLCNPIKGFQSRWKRNPGPFALATDHRIRMADRAI